LRAPFEPIQSLLRVGPAALETGSDAHLQLVNSASSPISALQDSSSRALNRSFPAESPLLALVRILPDEITDTGEEGDHQTDGADTGENYDIDKHGCLLREACVGMASN
jgi:hypothetical protein